MRKLQTSLSLLAVPSKSSVCPLMAGLDDFPRTPAPAGAIRNWSCFHVPASTFPVGYKWGLAPLVMLIAQRPGYFPSLPMSSAGGASAPGLRRGDSESNDCGFVWGGSFFKWISPNTRKIDLGFTVKLQQLVINDPSSFADILCTRNVTCDVLRPQPIQSRPASPSHNQGNALPLNAFTPCFSKFHRFCKGEAYQRYGKCVQSRWLRRVLEQG